MLVSSLVPPRMGTGIMTRVIRAQTLAFIRDPPHTRLSLPAAPPGPHFAEEKTEAQGSEVTCLRLHTASQQQSWDLSPGLGFS